MCGIVGKLYFDSERPVDTELFQRMMDAMEHRGPDGEGKYFSGGLALGHRRLSIIDLSSNGTQPMSNEDGTVWIVFNGEVYNFQELRCRLRKKGHVFRSGTDTEVIVHLYEEYGVECLAHLRGMFGFAIWDCNDRSLFVARDRVGIKPVYYTHSEKGVTFASEIKALTQDRELVPEVNIRSIDRFLTYLYLPGEETLLSGVWKLLPGHYLLVRNGKVACRQYWDIQFDVEERFQTLDDAAGELSELLEEVVREHMISDVPVGLLASGGVDSTAVLSYATSQSSQPIQTFTVGFAGAGFTDEREYARIASARFGTTHREISISADDFGKFLPGYVWHMEEPVCEPPAVALYYVSRLARQHVKVLLSGEGGDEAFGGYPEHRHYPLLERCKALAGPLRGIAGRIVDGAARVARSRKLQKYAALTDIEMDKYYYSRTSSPYSYFNRNKKLLYSEEFRAGLVGKESTAFTQELFGRVKGEEILNQMLYVDTRTWLPDDLLIKADRMTMASSVELRVPLLDHRVLEFAARLPVRFKVQGKEGKRVLKRAFEGRIPKEILERKKVGFPVPFGKWLRGELRELAMDTLLSDAALGRGYFNRKGIERLFDGKAGNEEVGAEVFSLLILELWHGLFIGKKAL